MGLPAALVAAAGAAGAATVGGAATTALPVDNVSTTVPSDTLSPTLTLTDCTVPPSGDGTSIVALSDSSEMSGSSAFTVSPALTNTSITGMSLKSPMSGTFTSAIAPMSPPIQYALRIPCVAAYTVQGSGRSVSSPYFLIAWSTTSGLISPSSASAFSAATAT